MPAYFCPDCHKRAKPIYERRNGKLQVCAVYCTGDACGGFKVDYYTSKDSDIILEIIQVERDEP